jgi:hypothetical protein
MLSANDIELQQQLAIEGKIICQIRDMKQTYQLDHCSYLVGLTVTMNRQYLRLWQVGKPLAFNACQHSQAALQICRSC